MIDPAVVLMEGCYGIMCLQYGWHKMREASYLYSRKGVALILIFYYHTVLAPITGTIDLFKRVK